VSGEREWLEGLRPEDQMFDDRPWGDDTALNAAADEIERLRDELARHRALVDELRGMALPSEVRAATWATARRLLARHGFGGEPMCPACGHVLRRHDPAEGTCDVFAGMELGTCPCGRSNTT
jgi:hypothetical protein